MRIVAGRFRGRRLETPSGSITRPTADRVRESLFSMLEARYDLEGSSVLDLYAGSGALGLESLSRGAGSVTFVERDRRACACIRNNVKSLNVERETTIVCRRVDQFLKAASSSDGGRYRVVFADPPYADDATGLPALVRSMIEEGGVFVLEHAATQDQSSSAHHTLTRRYGRTAVSLFEFA